MAKYVSESGLGFEIVLKDSYKDDGIRFYHFIVRLDFMNIPLFQSLEKRISKAEFEYEEYNDPLSTLEQLLVHGNEGYHQTEPLEPDIQFTILHESEETKQLFIMIDTTSFAGSDGSYCDEGIGIKIVIDKADIAKFVEDLKLEINEYLLAEKGEIRFKEGEKHE